MPSSLLLVPWFPFNVGVSSLASCLWLQATKLSWCDSSWITFRSV